MADYRPSPPNGPQMPHEVFGHMAEKYGPIFQLKLGVNQVVVVSDHNIVKECFTTNDMAFANRPKTLASEILARRIEMFSHIREFEVKSAVKEIYDKGNNLNGVVKMEMKEWFGNLIMKIVMKILFGVQYKGDDDEEKRRAQKATRRSFELLGAFVVADFLPYLRWLDIGGHEKALKETAKEIDCLGEE
ncbi:hypothetical protein CQW23_34799 [Capsicum baccatum]|uniref:Cytochrome n=1 Tax=Capsicum baccatum TaxID=33114 RepID=A0A2G2UY27_CAPBA|nr:hypothetical protein CQW23_34799 [Capsicum baccatum]